MGGGRVVRGAVSAGDPLELVGFAPVAKRVQLRAVVLEEQFPLPFYLLEGVAKQDIWRGQVLAAPGTIQPAKSFRAEVLFAERHERITQQPIQGIWYYRFRMRHTDISGTLHLPAGKHNIAHGDHFTATIVLRDYCALEVGLHFGIGRLLGQGTVLEVIS